MRSRNNHGFTLIELLVVVAIIAILATVGIPIYQRYLQDADDIIVKQNHQIITAHFSSETFKLATTGRNMFLSDDLYKMRDQQKAVARKLLCENAAKYYQSLADNKKVTIVGKNTYMVNRIKCFKSDVDPNPGHTWIQYYANDDRWTIVSRFGICPKLWGNCPRWEKDFRLTDYYN